MAQPAHVRKGDLVIVISGSHKGKKGKILRVLGDRVVVEKVAMVKRHTKATQQNPQGGIDRFEAPLHISKVAVADKDGKATRVRFETRDGKKVRVAVKSGEAIDG